jgi:hypothetical protein
MHPSLINEDLKNWAEQHVMKNRRSSLDESHEKFSQIYRSLIHEIVTEHLHYKKKCERWVSRLLNTEHKSRRMGAALTFLECYHQQGDNFWTRYS